jgi:hypothetical protein
MLTFINQIKIFNLKETVYVINTARKVVMNIVFVMCVVQTETSQFPLDTVYSVTLGVMDRYHTTCVYLLHSTYAQGKFHEKRATFIQFCSIKL